MQSSQFQFKPELVHLLKWFNDSPDTGDPACICSYCAKVIEDNFDDDEGNGEIPIRMWRGDGKDTQELRLHMDCARLVIIGWSSRDQEYIHHPEFTAGQEAFKAGWRRGSNPWSKGGPDRFRLAWEAGWDDAWEKRES